MVTRAKIIVSETEPEIEFKVIEEGQPPVPVGIAGVQEGFLWFQPSADTFYKVVDTDPLSWEALTFQGIEGLTGTKTIAGYTFTFTKGLLTGFTAP